MSLYADLERVVITRTDYWCGQRVRDPWGAPQVGVAYPLSALLPQPADRPVYGVAIAAESEVRGVLWGSDNLAPLPVTEQQPLISSGSALASSARLAAFVDRLDVTDGLVALWLAYSPEAAQLLRPVPVQAYARVRYALSAAQIAAGWNGTGQVLIWCQAPRAVGTATVPAPMRAMHRYNLGGAANIFPGTAFYDYDPVQLAPGAGALPFIGAGWALAPGNASNSEAPSVGLDIFRLRVPVTGGTGDLDGAVYVARA